MQSGSCGSVWPARTAACTDSAVARATGRRPTKAFGAVSQRPRQGTFCTRTPLPRIASSLRVSSAEPASSQEIDWQTRTVRPGGGVPPFFTTSKWW